MVRYAGKNLMVTVKNLYINIWEDRTKKDAQKEIGIQLFPRKKEKNNEAKQFFYDNYVQTNCLQRVFSTWKKQKKSKVSIWECTKMSRIAHIFLYGFFEVELTINSVSTGVLGNCWKLETKKKKKCQDFFPKLRPFFGLQIIELSQWLLKLWRLSAFQ